MDWKEAIAFVQAKQEGSDNSFLLFVWKRLQLGDRTQDLLMTVKALKALEDDASSASPEWESAIKWLTWQRAQASNLMLDMLWAQLESGNRTPELLALIRQASQASPAPAPEAPIPAPQAPETPPSTDF